MAKRFTDSEKWKKPFIRSMKAPYKLLWLYILDECDHAGIWQVDIEVAQIKIGEALNTEDALKYFGEKVISFSNGEKWFIPDFIEFQYGQLKNDNRAHNSAIQILNKFNLIDEQNKPLISPLQGAMDKDKDKVKDKEMDKDKEKGGEEIEIWPSFNDFWDDYEKKVGKPDTKKQWDKLSQKDKEAAIRYIPAYKLTQPEKKFRKDPERYLSKRGWENEIVIPNTGNSELEDYRQQKLLRLQGNG